MYERKALIVINFYDAHQSLRNAFAKLIQQEQWARYPGLPNAYCTTYLTDESDDVLVDQAEADLSSAAIAAGIEEWDACCIIEEQLKECSDALLF